MAPLLDTHVWIWWLLGDDRLPKGWAAALDRLPEQDRPLLSDISLWEVATLVDLGRLTLHLPLDAWLARAAAPATVRRVAIGPDVVTVMNSLPSTFHRDPADRVIVATARALHRPLATCDGRILTARLAERWTPGRS